MSEFIIYLLIGFLSIFLFFQIYFVVYLRKIIQKLIELLLLFDQLAKKAGPKEKNKETITRTCANCKNRVPFYLNDPDYHGYFYYRCQLTKKHVLPDSSCAYFILDPQISDAH